MGWVRHFFLLVLMLLGACSPRGAIEAFAPREDQAFAREMVSRLRTNDGPWLRERFAPELWAKSSRHLGAAPAQFPREVGTTELIGFNFATETVNGATRRTKQYVLVTQGGGRWTVTSFQTLSTGGPDRVVQWSVVPHGAPPPELAMLDAWEAALPWFWAGMAVAVVGVGSLVFWLVRRSRRRHDPWAGRPGARPEA